MKINTLIAIFSSLTLLQVPAILAVPSLTNNVHEVAKRHHNARAVTARALVPVDNPSSNKTIVEKEHLSKRVSGARFSFYNAGLGACGGHNSDGDFIVALNQAQWDGGAHCFETITISYGGQSTQATIVDLCPGCPYGGLDFSRGLFTFFAAESAGILWGEWEFGFGAPPPTSTWQPPPPPTSTWQPPPPPTSTWQPPPPPTSTWQPPTPTPEPSHMPTEESSSSDSERSTSSTSSSAQPSATAKSPPPGVIGQFNQAFINLAGLASAASAANPA